ncbi:hypothetical protein F4779DRAFT_292646 [Xylariaceae sp. FL0662B]|nr:hypothetical protein F4779DRAFT_292646 [Xylariaceae sp. FL0662B]
MCPDQGIVAARMTIIVLLLIAAYFSFYLETWEHRGRAIPVAPNIQRRPGVLDHLGWHGSNPSHRRRYHQPVGHVGPAKYVPRSGYRHSAYDHCNITSNRRILSSLPGDLGAPRPSGLGSASRVGTRHARKHMLFRGTRWMRGPCRATDLAHIVPPDSLGVTGSSSPSGL